MQLAQKILFRDARVRRNHLSEVRSARRAQIARQVECVVRERAVSHVLK